MTTTYKLFGIALLACSMLLSACNSKPKTQQSTEKSDEEWIQLFNGKDIDDWTPKFTGYELGVNYKNTFRVEDGLLRVSYEDWEEWNGEFGHLFYKDEFSHYRLRVEYRFVGPQLKNAPNWAFAALSGLFLGLAAITRSSELLWLAPGLGLLWLFNIQPVCWI